MEKYNSKRIPGEKKYIIYATILFFIIINLFFLPKSTEGIISLPENQNENPISPSSINNKILKIKFLFQKKKTKMKMKKIMRMKIMLKMIIIIMKMKKIMMMMMMMMMK